MNNNGKGTLFGLGVGPGDPKLVTVAAMEILGRVPVVFAAGSSKNDYSLAFNVVAGYLSPTTQVRKLDFPMTQDQDQLDAAWRANARAVIEVLDAGLDAAFITIGDSLTYSTYGYLVRTLLSLDPKAQVRTIPGITAYAAAAARLNLPLVESKESLLVVSGVSEPEDIGRLAACGDNVVIMKTYRNYDQIMDALEGLPEKRETYSVSNCGLPGERLQRDAVSLRGEPMPYLSLVIVKGPCR